MFQDVGTLGSSWNLEPETWNLVYLTLFISLFSLERETGFEPATPSLEGWNSTTELLPHFNNKEHLKQKIWSWRSGLNRRPTDYKSVALPLSYTSPFDAKNNFQSIK